MRREGFALIEIVIVIAIAIVVLVAVVVLPRMKNAGGRGWKIVQGGEVMIFKRCGLTNGYCYLCERGDGSEITICGDMTIERLEAGE